MNKYGQYCPTARAVELLGDRWTLLIVRDLSFGGRHFNELERGLPGIPKALLSGRLRRLQNAGVIERQEESAGHKNCYQLTLAGLELYPVIESLTRWGAKWAFGEPEQTELDPVLLMWWMRDRVFAERLPQQRVVVEFDFLESRPRRFWLVLKPDDVSVCVTYPGFEIDVLVTAQLAVLYKIWLGRLSFSEAERSEQLVIDAVPGYVRAFPTWFALSPVAQIVRETVAA